MSAETNADWGARRRAAVWINVVAQSLLLLALLAVVNLIALKSPKRWDCTSVGAYTLSSIAEDLLQGLTYDVEIWMNADPGSVEDKSLPAAFLRTVNLLEEFRKRTDRIKVNFITTQEAGQVRTVMQHFGMVSPATMYILITHPDKRTNKKALEIYSLFEGNALTGEVTSYRGEPVLIQAIRDLGGAAKRIVYEVGGHQELLTADATSLGVLERFMTMNEGVDFRKMVPVEYNSVPPDCDVLMILGPKQPFVQKELDLFRDYLERGGSMLVAVHPKARTGLETLLEEYGARVGDNVVHDAQNFVPPRMTDLLVTDFNFHEINRSMVNLGFRLPDCCTVDPVSKPAGEGWSIVPLLRSGPGSWEEKGPLEGTRRPVADGDERTGPQSLVVVVEKPATKARQKDQKAKLIVWGSAAPFTNGVLYNKGMFQQLQVQYITNHFRWLADRKILEITVPPVAVRPVDMSEVQVSTLRWVTGAGFPAFGILLGVLAWFIRRK